MRPCTLNGNVGSQPELRYTPQGTPVTSLRLACYAGEDQDGNTLTTWVTVTTWKDLAELICKRITKGDRIQVEGYLDPPRLWEDKHGATQAELRVTAWAIKALEYAAVELVPEPLPEDEQPPTVTPHDPKRTKK